MRAIALSLAVVLPAAAHAAEELVKVAVLDIKPQAGISKELASTVTGMVANEADRLDVFKVISKADIASMLQFEADKQLVGCEASESCLAEIGGALGVEHIIYGQLSKLGEAYNLQLTLASPAGAVENRVSENVTGGEGKLIDASGRAVKQLVSKILQGREGFLLLVTAEIGATVKIDGQVKGVTPMRGRLPLAWGPHLLEVEKQGFVTYAEDVQIPAKAALEKPVSLIPSPDFLSNYEGAANRMRLGAYITTGVAVLGVAGYAYGQIDQEISYTAFSKALETLAANETPENRKAAEELKAKGETDKVIMFASLGATVLSGGLAAFFWIAGEDPEKYARYREAPSAMIMPLPDGAMAVATARF
jgi:hypothetical protein